MKTKFKKTKTKQNFERVNKMKASYAVLLGLAILCVLLLTVTASASGTHAGTVISNQAKVKYQNAGGANMDSVMSNLVTTTVDRKVGLSLTLPSYSRIVGDSVYVTFPAVLTNTGNNTEKYNLTYVTQHGWGAQIYKDINRNSVLDPADTANGIIAVSDTIPEDSSFYFIVREFVPGSTLSGVKDTSLVSGSTAGFHGIVCIST